MDAKKDFLLDESRERSDRLERVKPANMAQHGVQHRSAAVLTVIRRFERKVFDFAGFDVDAGDALCQSASEVGECNASGRTVQWRCAEAIFASIDRPSNSGSLGIDISATMVCTSCHFK